jgi:transcriptional regulator with XRE-family HTH domain
MQPAVRYVSLGRFFAFDWENKGERGLAPIMSNFGQMLRTLRKEKRITQRQLAERVGIDFTYISKIESGTMDPPAEDKIIRMAEILGKDPDQFMIAAKKIPSDFHKVITENEEVPVFLRKAAKFTPDHWRKLKDIMDDIQ